MCLRALSLCVCAQAILFAVHLSMQKCENAPLFVKMGACSGGQLALLDSSSALLSARLQDSLSHLMKKRVDLLQITDAENRLTQPARTFPISCTTRASSSVMGAREQSAGGW